MTDQETTTCGELFISNPKYRCPVCGVVEFWIDISVKPYEGTYCQVCYARWISETFPRVEKIQEGREEEK